ncbi:MAG: hypothetical protein MRY74_17065 [Neomegalonema sp.]|nr:hypothetical protein [Neomegalonema sp.]
MISRQSLIRRGALSAGLLAGFWCAAEPARADAIYGCWSFDGKQVKVSPTRIVTPGGASPKAEIHRHGFSYIAPKSERDAGMRIVFEQLNEALATRIAVAPGADRTRETKVERWRPCEAASVS